MSTGPASSAALVEFADRIAAARPWQEPDLVRAGGRILARGVERKSVEPFLQASAWNDTAVALFRHCLRHHGFQFGTLPAGAGRTRGLATIWREGDAAMAVYQAATPALALLRGMATEIAREQQRRETGECLTCRGLGWYISQDNTKELCRHQMPPKFQPLRE